MRINISDDSCDLVISRLKLTVFLNWYNSRSRDWVVKICWLNIKCESCDEVCEERDNCWADNRFLFLDVSRCSRVKISIYDALWCSWVDVFVWMKIRCCILKIFWIDEMKEKSRQSIFFILSFLWEKFMTNKRKKMIYLISIYKIKIKDLMLTNKIKEIKKYFCQKTKIKKNKQEN